MCEECFWTDAKSPMRVSRSDQLETCLGLIAQIEKSHASLAQFRTETKYAFLSG
jgi:hypothetical protein